MYALYRSPFFHEGGTHLKREKQTNRAATAQHQLSELDVEQFPSNNSDSTIHSQKGENCMSTTMNFDSLYAAETTKSVSDYARYQELLRDIAAGKPAPANEEILALCERVGRDVAMLEEDVKWRQKRDKDIAEVHRQEEYKAEKEEANKALSKLNADFQKVREEYEKACWPHECKIAAMDQKLYQIFYLRLCLPEDCRDPNLHAELERLDSQSTNGYMFEKLKEKSEELRVEIEDAQRQLKEKTFTPDRSEKLQQLKANIKDMQAERERIQSQLAAMQQADATRDAEREKVREAMIFA